VTQNPFQDLLESEQARIIFDNAEVRGYVEPAELEAFALEHDLSPTEIEELTREVERLGHEIGEAKAKAEEAEQAAAAERRRQREQDRIEKATAELEASGADGAVKTPPPPAPEGGAPENAEEGVEDGGSPDKLSDTDG